jgi:lipoprotein-releasing system permease protein
MRPPFELFVALRYLTAKRKQAFISLISMISMAGIAVGVMALVVGLAVMTGQQREFRDRIVAATPHIYVWKIAEGFADYRAEAARMRTLPHVTGAAPAVLGKALTTTDRGEAFINLKGIDPALEDQVTTIRAGIRSGSLDALDSTGPDGLAGIALGASLAERLGLGLGDVVNVLSTTREGTRLSAMPTAQQLRVAAIFSLGLNELDAEQGFISLPVAQRLMGVDRPDLIQLRVDDVFAAPDIAADIFTQLGPDYLVRDWADMNQTMFAALWLQKLAMGIAISLIIIVAALNIVASLVLLVTEKTRDIAILKTMGASARSIRGIFMLQGLVIGVIGTTAGAAGGYALAHVFDRYRLISLPLEVYDMSYVPFTVLAIDFVVVIVAAIVLSFVATIYPSRQAARLNPVEALRFE